MSRCTLAEALLNRNLRVAAALKFNEAIRLDDTYAPAFEGLARCMIPEGPEGWPAALLRKAIDLDPAFNRARFELGTLSQMVGDFWGAVQVWSDLAKRQPDYPDLYARLAIAAYNVPDRSASIRYLAEADRRGQAVPPQFRVLLVGAKTP